MPPTTSRGNLVFIKGFLTRFSIRSTSTPRGGKLASLIGSPRCKISTLFLPTCWRSSLRWVLTPLTSLGGGPCPTTIGSSQTTLSSLPYFVLFTILWANQTVPSSMASATMRKGVQGLRQELGSRLRQFLLLAARRGSSFENAIPHLRYVTKCVHFELPLTY